MRRIVIVALALAVVVAACVWVSAVRFKDEASAWGCGVPLGKALHGRDAPRFLVDVQTNMSHSPLTGLFGVPKGTSPFVTVCRGEARTRVAIAAGAIVVAIGAVLLSRKRWRGGAQQLPASG